MKKRNILYTILAATVLSSCVRDEIEPCPPLQVNITVKDKNYFNVNQVIPEEKLPEDLAFRRYIPTLYYMLRDAATGKVVEEQGVFPVEGDGKTFPVTFCDCIPHGKYILTVWGGTDDLKPLSDDRLSANFHPANAEGNDIYLTNDTLVYDARNYDYTVDMERTKGKLIIQATNLPNGIIKSEKTVNGLFGKTDNRFAYSGETSVHTENPWDSPKQLVTKTLLSPSVKNNGSVVDVDLYATKGRISSTLLPPNVNITMKRNELTVLRYVYNENEDDFTIYILVNDNWEVIHGMEID